jgi:predicted house-cleaning noncanonical NTP pyrophosphatase (MazG superfamily)
MPVYNKLVRDRIPEIIQSSGRKLSSKVLTNADYISELRKKSLEELNEYLLADNNNEAIEELADLLEIIHSLAECHGSSIQEVEEIRKKKATERGRFKDRIFLIEVED